jgi:aromatic-L-amino-acid decarboxylase
VDDDLAMDVSALAGAVEEDRRAGIVPAAVVATVGTTSTGAVDPVMEIARFCAGEGIWLHVDAAYAGPMALCPEHRPLFAGWERADSIVVNPHKWLFTPMDLSALYVRDPAQLRATFSLVPPYLMTRGEADAPNLMDYGPALGRRFRSLKLWMVIRTFGTDGLAARIREHVALARDLAGKIDAEPDWERMAPARLGLVVLRHRPPAIQDPEALDRHNQALVEAVNAGGKAFLSGTRVRERWAIRCAIGNLRTGRRHVEETWAVLREEAAKLAG